MKAITRAHKHRVRVVLLAQAPTRQLEAWRSSDGALIVVDTTDVMPLPLSRLIPSTCLKIHTALAQSSRGGCIHNITILNTPVM